MLRTCCYLLIVMLLSNKSFSNKEAVVSLQNQIDLFGCYSLCCDQQARTYDNKPKEVRHIADNVEELTNIRNYFRNTCKNPNVRKMLMNSTTYPNVLRYPDLKVRKREFFNNKNNELICSYCINKYMLQVLTTSGINGEENLNMAYVQRLLLRSARSVTKTKDKVFLSNKTTNMIPTFMLPGLYTVPVRAISIHPSNLIPLWGGDIMNEFNQATLLYYRFHVEQIKYGIIQINVDTDKPQWKQTTGFTGLQVVEQKVRYISLVTQPESLHTAFIDRVHITCLRNLGNSNPIRLVLPVNFIRIHISISINRPLVIYANTVNDGINPHTVGIEGRTARLDSRYLEVRAEPWEKDSLIWFTLTKLPVHGHLFLIDRNSHKVHTNEKSEGRIYLGVSSQFTQEDLRAGNLFYTFRRVLDDSSERISDISSKRFRLTDEFKYRVHVEGAQPKTIYDFRIIISKVSTTTSISGVKFSPTITNRGGTVKEGGDLILKPELFYANYLQCKNISVQRPSNELLQNYDLYFQILSLPQHGTLLIRSPHNFSLTNLINLAEYNHRLISYNMLIYRHNGDEEFKDSFQFQFFCRQTPFSHSSDGNDDIGVQLTGLTRTFTDKQFGQPVTSVFRIRIIPVNDNPPNIFTTPLFVEIKKTNDTLSKSLRITDKDKSSQNDYFDNNNDEFTHKSDDFWIYWEESKRYHRNDIIYPSLGYFIQNLDMTIRHRFKYSEITNSLVSFKHMGLPVGQVKLKVMDGKFTVTKLLTVNVTTPNILVLQPDSITLRSVGRVFIPIEVVTNVDLDPNSIQIRISRSGCFGNLMLFGLTKHVTNWTYSDLLKFPLYYEYIRSWNQYGNQSMTTFKDTAHSLYCNLLYTSNKTNKNQDWIGLRSDEIHLIVSATISGYMLQHEVRLPITLNPLKLWNNVDINKGNDFKFTNHDLIVEAGKSVIVQPVYFATNNNVNIFSQIPVTVNQTPRFGILHLCTTNFKISPIKYFTLADLFSGRILYESLTNRLNTMHSYHKQSLLVKDCMTVVLYDDQFQYQMSNAVNNETKIQSEQVICISIIQRGLDLKHWNLVLEPNKHRSLTDLKLTPILVKENPVRHDEPFLINDINSFSQTNKSTGDEMPQLLDGVQELDVPFVYNTEYSTSITGKYKDDNNNNEKLFYTVKNGPNYGLIISKTLNRPVRLFSDVDLATNDIYYQNFGNQSISEDSVDLAAIELSTETMTVNPVKIRFTVSEINPRPYLKACGPMRILIGSSAVIKTDYLRAELTSGFDSGQITFEIMYTHQGHIGFVGSSHVSLSTFTQMDLQRGRVEFIHSGSQKSTACGFGFVLMYNLYRSEIYHFQIIPGTVKLNVVNNQTLLVFPKGFEVITRHHLDTEIKFTAQKSMEHDTRSTALRNCNLSDISFSPEVKSHYDLENELDLQVVYKVLSQPKYGSIIKFSTADKNQLLSWNDSITKFTQEEITVGRIAYTFYPNKWPVAIKQFASLRDQSDIEDEYTVSASIVKRPTIMNMEDENNYDGNHKNDHTTGNIINNYDQTRHLASHIIFCSISLSFNYILRYNQNRLLKITPLLVHNGQDGEITLNHINANQLREFLENNGSESRSLKISKTPEHGTLWLGSKIMKPGSIIPGVFSGTLGGKLIYQHDGSPVKEDYFELLVYQLNRTLKSYEQPIIFPIQIVPKFNASLHLIRPLSLISTDSLSIKNKKLVIVEMNDYVTISNEHIFVQHEFIQPQFINIHFKILPKYGNLYYSYNSFKQEHEVLLPECEILHTITQNDINLRRLRYFANNIDNTKRNINIPIYDSVTFDVYQNEYPNLHLKKLTGILEFQIMLNNFVLNDSVQLNLMQNETKLWLDTEILNVQLSRWRNYQYNYQTNHSLFFFIQELPNYGKIFIDTIPVNGFSYAQLEQKRVYYAKTSFSTYSDSFTIEIVRYFCGATLRSRSIVLNLQDNYKQNFINQVPSRRSSYMTFTVNIIVKSLVSFDTIYISPGKMTKINAENIKINKFSEFLQLYNIPNLNQPKVYQKSMPVTMFTFPTGTMLKTGRFYIDDRLVISIGYLNDKPTSSINISLQDFLSNNVHFEAYRINDESLEIYEETVPFIFTFGTLINSQTHLNFSDPIFVQPGYGDLKVSIKSISFSTRSNNSHSNNDSMNQSVSSSSVLSSTVKSDHNSKYPSTSKIAFTIAGLALSLAFISVVIICSVSCCIYKRKNKADKSLTNISGSSEKYVSTPYSIVTTTLSRGIINSPNKYILKSNRDSIELCSNKKTEESEKLYTDELASSPILSNKLTRLTFDNNVSINHIIPEDSILPSAQDYSCSCDFSGAVVYWTTDMAIDTALSHGGCQSDSNHFNCNTYNSNHTFHLFSTSGTIKPPLISSPLSSNVLQMQEDTEQFSSPVLLAQLPSDNLNIPHLTFLSSQDATKQINMDTVPYQSQFACKNNVKDNKNHPKSNHESIQVSSEIMDVVNFKNTDKVNESHCVESLCNDSPKYSSVNKPITYIVSNIYDKHFDINYMNQMV
ncbi:hypothetical protein MN116_006140 [Schistosoma mekongi]|uniref:Chondroitin sulfate proteoglycan 4 n=1 Tax=Schistosoma mekongi TaxID=38744 RepID=A0AAE1ZCA2_SCHME|nr:hypothetical protein MN116_006140 [Schistosoma mekongi]